MYLKVFEIIWKETQTKHGSIKAVNFITGLLENGQMPML